MKPAFDAVTGVEKAGFDPSAAFVASVERGADQEYDGLARWPVLDYL